MRRNDIDGAMRSVSEAVRLKPDSAALHYSLADLNFQLARLDAARNHCRRAIELDPQFGRAPYDLNNTLAAPDAGERAIERLRQIVWNRPDDPQLRAWLGQTLQFHRKPREAIEQYRAALAIDPDLAPALNNLAWLYATHPDDSVRNGAEALSLAERVNRIMKDNPSALDTLAAAYAEAGRFDEAADTLGKAVKLAEEAKADTLTRELRHRLSLYVAKKPYRGR